MSEKNRDSPSVSEKRGRKFLHRQSKELLYKLYHFMKKEANEGPISLKQTQVRLSQATGVSCRTIQRALKEVKESNGSSAPRKHRLRKKYKTNLDDFDKSVVRETIYDFHLNHVEHLTLKKLLLILMEKINFKGSISSLRRIIKEMGFQWKKANNDNRKILAEKPAIRELRLSYLRALKHYRKQQRPIVFTDESYINPSDSKHFTYTDGSSVPISKNQRAMIVHAGCEAGLISNALLIFKTEQKPVDDNAMNYAKYEMWVRDKLIPNLPANSVVVMDNASYHNTQMNLAPTFSSRKEEMVEWLINHNIPHSTDMCIPELHKLIQLHKPRYKAYKIDAILAEHGHSVLRLPQYSPELNPIEMVWATAKDYMAQRNVNFNLDDAIRLFEEAINTISNDDWKLKCDQVREIEDSYLHRETLIDITNERLIKPIQIESSTYSGESESNSDTDEESESGEGTDSDSHGMNLFVELFE